MEKLRLSHAGRLIELPPKLYTYEPTHASRYWIIAYVLSALGASKGAGILDVGGKKGLLRFFPGFAPTVIDIDDSDEPRFVKGSALDMPFADGQFDFAVSCDVLEHIPQADRRRFLLEMLRVSKRGIILCAPFDHDQNPRLERDMNDYYKSLTNQQHHWLREHIDNGLPREQEVEKTLQKHGYAYTKFRHFSPQVWQTIVKLHLLHTAFGDSQLLDTTVHTTYRNYYQQLCTLDFADDGYRTFFWVSKEGTPSIELPTPSAIQQARDNFVLSSESLLFDLAEQGLRDRRLCEQAIPKEKALQDALKRTQQQLAQSQLDLQTIKSNKVWRTLHRVKSIAKRVTPTAKADHD